MTTHPPIERALLSVSDKTGLVALARQLVELNITLLATGGTASQLKANAVALTEVSDHTGFPEIMQGRVKTLHPAIHGGILARRDSDQQVLREHNIAPIDLVIVNLYPFSQTVAQPNCTLAEAIENIDIGGPTMVRAAAKNHRYVTVLVDPADYPIVIAEIQAHGNTSLTTRRRLAHKAFAHTAAYDRAIEQYLATSHGAETESCWPTHYMLDLQQSMTLRYGENPHQRAALYHYPEHTAGTLAGSELLQGKPLSYNNLQDANAALACVRELNNKQAACAIIKHATPAGVAQASDLRQAYQRALRTDPVASFGGIIAFNQPVEADTAEAIVAEQFVEVLLAPSFSTAACQVFSRKTNLRLLAYGHQTPTALHQLRSISGGVLLQEQDVQSIEPAQFVTVSQRKATEQQLADLIFAWQVVKHVKSNAIVYAKDQATLGIGTGQTSRVFSAEIAALKASQMNLSLAGAVMASDAFFPFADSVELAAKAGIEAIIQPGGSKRDQEVIAAADKQGLVMIMTGLRHFSH